MSFIRDLTAAASRSEASVATLLRMVKVAGSRSGADDLVRWTDKELNGYEEGDDLPTYRAPFRVAVFCELAGPFRFHQNRVRLPIAALPIEVQSDALDHVSFIETIAGVEAWISLGTERIHVPWETHFVDEVNSSHRNGEFQIVDVPSAFIKEAWREVPIAKLLSVTETIRNQVLEFSLALERAAPDAGEPDAASAASDAVIDVGRRALLDYFHLYGRS